MYRQLTLLATALLLCGCPGDHTDSQSSKSAEAARIEKEVAKRVEKEVAIKAIEMDIEVRKTRMKTIRLLGLIILVGGAVGGLVWLQRYRGFTPGPDRERPLQLRRWWDHYTTPSNRILDLQPPERPAIPAPQAARNEAGNPPRRRRASRRRHRNHNPRNHYPDETPSDH